MTYERLRWLFFRFALKRHRNIHEKYGRTKPNPTSSGSDDTATNNTSTDSVNTATVTTVATTTQESTDHEEIIETKFVEKFETVDSSNEMGEEMSDISELQVQLQWNKKCGFVKEWIKMIIFAITIAFKWFSFSFKID